MFYYTAGHINEMNRILYACASNADTHTPVRVADTFRFL